VASKVTVGPVLAVDGQHGGGSAKERRAPAAAARLNRGPDHYLDHWTEPTPDLACLPAVATTGLSVPQCCAAPSRRTGHAPLHPTKLTRGQSTGRRGDEQLCRLWQVHHVEQTGPWGHSVSWHRSTSRPISLTHPLGNCHRRPRAPNGANPQVSGRFPIATPTPPHGSPQVRVHKTEKPPYTRIQSGPHDVPQRWTPPVQQFSRGRREPSQRKSSWLGSLPAPATRYYAM